MPETATIVPVEGGWLVRARGFEAVVEDLREATHDIARLIAELRENYGVTVDFGYDMDEWDGAPDRIAHLLLNAVNRAESSGVDYARGRTGAILPLGSYAGAASN